MEIVRANTKDTDIFSKAELDFGACCFFTEDRKSKYFFEIKGREATFYTNTDQYIDKAIEEFLFYSSFITSVKDKNGQVLETKHPAKPYLLEISKIQPSQFFINEVKLESCKKWIKSAEDIFIPIVIKDGKYISQDGHTRMKAAIDLGYTAVYVYPDEYDDTIFHFVDEAVRRNINSVMDMEIVSDEEYKVKWDGFCDDLFKSLE
ncbi:MAG: hypothetical protein FWD03_07980 [Defluviitaleaceae bacterium]|nr:hypothetical protein [Defluviitaleaceae bacterium]